MKPRKCSTTIERSEEHTSELQSRNDISYAVFCLKKKNRPPGGRPARPQPDRHRGPEALRAGRAGGAELGGDGRVRARDGRAPAFFFFFFNDTATTEIYTSLHTLSLHDALPISGHGRGVGQEDRPAAGHR